MRPLKILLFSTCKGRLWQAKKTLKHNLRAVNAFKGRTKLGKRRAVEFQIVVVDYGDPEKIYRYILEEHKLDYESGRISVFRVKDPPVWRMAVVKNIGGRCALHLGADYVVSLDIDNFVTIDELHMLSSLAEQKLGYHGIRKYGDGTAGRIGCCSEHFQSLNGFREDSPPAAQHDVNFVARLSKLSPIVRLPSLKLPIQNDKTATIKHTELETFSDYIEVCRHFSYPPTAPPSMSTQVGDWYHQGNCSENLKI